MAHALLATVNGRAVSIARAFVASGFVASAAMLVLCIGSPARAAVFTVDLDGVLTAQDAPGVDPRFQVGDEVRVKAQFDWAHQTPWPGQPFNVAGVYDQPFTVSLDGVTWTSVDYIYDRQPFFTFPDGRTLDYPAIMFAGGKVLGLVGDLLPVDSATTPRLDLGSTILTTGTAVLSPTFHISSADGLYGNTSETLGFTGVWDLDNSYVLVPEPRGWALLLAGFALIGVAKRRRRRVVTL